MPTDSTAYVFPLPIFSLECFEMERAVIHRYHTPMPIIDCEVSHVEHQAYVHMIETDDELYSFVCSSRLALCAPGSEVSFKWEFEPFAGRRHILESSLEDWQSFRSLCEGFEADAQSLMYLIAYYRAYPSHDDELDELMRDRGAGVVGDASDGDWVHYSSVPNPTIH